MMTAFLTRSVDQIETTEAPNVNVLGDGAEGRACIKSHYGR